MTSRECSVLGSPIGKDVFKSSLKSCLFYEQNIMMFYVFVNNFGDMVLQMKNGRGGGENS